MRRSLLLYILLSLLLSLRLNNVFSKNFVAKVIKLNGKVSKLLPNTKIATIVKVGDQLPEDTSLLTYEHSGVIVKFFDGSTLNLGPNSKIAITKFSKHSESIISLIMGQVRLKIISWEKAKNKFFLKTQTASLGVRGTEFISIFNAQSKATSLVTIEGAVAIAKNSKDKSRSIDKQLSTQNTSLVRKGKFAGVLLDEENATIPVKISPRQFSILERNSLTGPNGNDKNPRNDILEKNDPDPKGYYDEANKQLAPQAGGYLDFKTGLYIPPGEDSKLDKELNVYIANNDIGDLDENSGDYVPPKGLALDPVDGFVIANKDAISKDHENLNETKLMLNRKIRGLKNNSDSNESLAQIDSSDEGKEYYERNRVSIEYGFLKNQIKFQGPNSTPTYKQKASNGMKIDLGYDYKLLKNYYIGGKLNLSGFTYTETPDKKNYNLMGANLTIAKQIDSRWNILGEIGFKNEIVEDNRFAYSRNNLKLRETTHLLIGTDINFNAVKCENLDFDLDIGLSFLSGKKHDSIGEISGALGYSYGISLVHHAEKNIHFKFFTKVINEKYKVNSLEQSRRSIVPGLGILVNF